MNLDIIGSFKILDNIHNTTAMSSSKVIYLQTWIFFNLLLCFYMSNSKIHNMNIVTDTRSIWCSIIIAKYTKFF